MFKSIIRSILVLLYKTFNFPRMSCYGLKDDCANRSFRKNKICDGYVTYKMLRKKKYKSIKYKPRRKKYKYDRLQKHHIIYDELHDYKG